MEIAKQLIGLDTKVHFYFVLSFIFLIAQQRKPELFPLSYAPLECRNLEQTIESSTFTRKWQSPSCKNIFKVFWQCHSEFLTSATKTNTKKVTIEALHICKFQSTQRV